MKSLCRLFGARTDPTAFVAQRRGATGPVEVRWRELSRDVAALRRRLGEEPPGGWILLTEDAYAFAVGLLGLWHSGRHAISPPNRQPGALRTLQTRAAGVLSDRPEWVPDATCVDPLAPGVGDEDSPLEPLAREAPALELYTSGTTGAAKPILKRIRHLDDEVAQLEATWGARLAGANIVSAVSHQHLYGLLFGVLWPLCAGRGFLAGHPFHVRELVPRLLEPRRSALVSVPTHLRRLAHHADLASLREHCALVFSSGGPLARETAEGLARVLGSPPVEVLGSTETGGIAWRVQEPHRGESPWTPLPGVQVRRDPHRGVARVRSPFVSVGGPDDEFATGDRIRLRWDGRFVLEGRGDRVVKVAEKRLDLAQMESHLRAHPWVDEVALGTVVRGGEARVAAALVIAPAARQELAREGPRALGAALGASLGEAWDPVLHPRLWRVLERLPENPQGKVSQADLAGLFVEPVGLGRVGDRPEVLEELRGEGFVEQSCRVPQDLACLAGHFPDAPIVPGVLLVDWAMERAGALLGEPPRVEEVVSLKLLRPLRPRDRFRIRVEATELPRVDFELWLGEELAVRGRVRLGGEGREP